VDQAAPVALRTATDYLAAQEQGGIELVRFVLYGWQIYQVYQRALTQLTETNSLDR
jgi:hypothetical protein